MPSTEALKLAAWAAPTLSLTVASADLCFSTLFAPTLLSTAEQSSPSLALHQIRKSFQIGQFIFPTSAVVAGALFGLLARAAPAGSNRRSLFVLSAVLNVIILPITNGYL